MDVSLREPGRARRPTGPLWLVLRSPSAYARWLTRGLRTPFVLALIVQAILSWINPHSPLTPLLTTVTWRFVRPLQRLIPPIGNIDLSTLALIILCQLALIIPIVALENLAFKLF